MKKLHSGKGAMAVFSNLLDMPWGDVLTFLARKEGTLEVRREGRPEAV